MGSSQGCPAGGDDGRDARAAAPQSGRRRSRRTPPPGRPVRSVNNGEERWLPSGSPKSVSHRKRQGHPVVIKSVTRDGMERWLPHGSPKVAVAGAKAAPRPEVVEATPPARPRGEVEYAEVPPPCIHAMPPAPPAYELAAPCISVCPPTGSHESSSLSEVLLPTAQFRSVSAVPSAAGPRRSSASTFAYSEDGESVASLVWGDPAPAKDFVLSALKTSRSPPARPESHGTAAQVRSTAVQTPHAAAAASAPTPRETVGVGTQTASPRSASTSPMGTLPVARHIIHSHVAEPQPRPSTAHSTTPVIAAPLSPASVMGVPETVLPVLTTAGSPQPARRTSTGPCGRGSRGGSCVSGARPSPSPQIPAWSSPVAHGAYEPWPAPASAGQQRPRVQQHPHRYCHDQHYSSPPPQQRSARHQQQAFDVLPAQLRHQRQRPAPRQGSVWAAAQPPPPQPFRASPRRGPPPYEHGPRVAGYAGATGHRPAHLVEEPRPCRPSQRVLEPPLDVWTVREDRTMSPRLFDSDAASPWGGLSRGSSVASFSTVESYAQHAAEVVRLNAAAAERREVPRTSLELAKHEAAAARLPPAQPEVPPAVLAPLDGNVAALRRVKEGPARSAHAWRGAPSPSVRSQWEQRSGASPWRQGERRPEPRPSPSPRLDTAPPQSSGTRRRPRLVGEITGEAYAWGKQVKAAEPPRAPSPTNARGGRRRTEDGYVVVDPASGQEVLLPSTPPSYDAVIIVP